jgi:hypothetical protein
MVWDPNRITPAPWAAVLAAYRRIEERNDDFRPLTRLVEHVLAAPYAPSIFAATSGTALLVARQEDADWALDALRIDVDLSGSVRFVLPKKRAPRAPTYSDDGAKIVPAFESFLRDAGWI